MPTLTQNLRDEYLRLFTTCHIREDKAAEINGIVERMERHLSRYQTIERVLGVPWYVVATIHAMESGVRFDCHLHNGDPLSDRTIHVPKGRPVAGRPPFVWEDSAEDALKLAGLDSWTDWSEPGVLFKLESYNGWGYRNAHPDVLTPYLWSYSNHYTRGKYTADGSFSPAAVSKQCGAAVLLRRLVEKHPNDIFSPHRPSTAEVSR